MKANQTRVPDLQVFALNPTVSSGENIKFVVKIGTNWVGKWKLLMADLERPVLEGNLTNTPQLVFGSVESEKTGRFQTLFIVERPNGQREAFPGCELSVTSAGWSNFAPTVFASFFGMGLTVAAFFIKDWYSIFIKRRRLRQRFRILFKQFDGGRSFEVPNWVKEKGNNEWGDLMFEEPFWTVCEKLTELEKRKSAGLSKNFGSDIQSIERLLR